MTNYVFLKTDQDLKTDYLNTDKPLDPQLPEIDEADKYFSMMEIETVPRENIWSSEDIELW